MEYEDCLACVLDQVLSSDLPDEALGQALADAAGLMTHDTDSQ